MDWWWEFLCKEGNDNKSITHLDCDKKKSMQEEDASKICVGLIIMCSLFDVNHFVRLMFQFLPLQS